jgi:signal transduction histidine kinase
VAVPGTGDEIERLAHTMNALLDRLDLAATRQQRFVSDASHELRTPLSVIRTTVEVARAHPASLPPGDALDRIALAAGRTEELVDELLELARLDETAGAPPADVDLDDVVVDVVAGRGDPRVGTSVVPVRVTGDAAQLRRVAENLVANAARHARQRIVVALRAEGGEAVLEVVDDGPGVPPGARDHIFDRFTRLDEARSESGWGLGLAIVAGVVRRHGGTVTVADAPGGGARFTVRLPLQHQGTWTRH